MKIYLKLCNPILYKGISSKIIGQSGKMVRSGVLPPTASAEFIAKSAKYVKIHEQGIEKICAEMLKSISSNKLAIPETGANIQYLTKEDHKSVDWIFVADALNFCFWSFSGVEKWTVEGHSGYYALEAALSRALREGYDITNPEYYSKITKNDLETILRGDNEAKVPLFNERLDVLHEVGGILLEKFNGTFKTCLEQANKSAVTLLEIIVDNFPCFRDEALYNGQKVAIYKRAQILVADLWNFFDGKGWGEFSDIDKITMFADYRIPQVLVYFGVLSYTDDLMELIKSDVVLPSGSEREVEIRGCTIHAVELIKKLLQEKLADNKDVEPPNSSVIDYYLWCYRRKYAEELEKVPFHKTFGIFY